MRRDTACFSIYSDMSKRMRLSSLPKRAAARARHSSVLPTPVGPKNRKVPTGRPGSFRPTRPRRMARATADTARSWPTTRRWSSPSSASIRWDSLWVTVATGMPVHWATTWATCSAVSTVPSVPERRLSFRSSSWRKSRSASRSMAARSKSCRAAASSFSRAATRARSASSRRAGGSTSPSMRSRAQPSSMRSMALSGKNRWGRYRRDRSTAAVSASSEMVRRWCCSYRLRMPRRISRVCSRVGSATVTGWKRRSRAASFSMYLRYSSSVVAPTTWMSPLDRAGLRILAASMAPSAEPAPMMLCSSSKNRMMFPARRTSPIMTFTRSSNSPRYLVPATMADRSRLKRRLSRSGSGTAPAASRRANASATAVLPTPGSPMRAGLFLVRRDRIWITRATSCSRPTTGSSRPVMAMRVRSLENRSVNLVSPPSRPRALGSSRRTAGGCSGPAGPMARGCPAVSFSMRLRRMNRRKRSLPSMVCSSPCS